MTGGELARELAKGTIRPAYLLAGEEALIRDDALREIRGAVLGQGDEAFNLHRLSGDSVTPGRLREALQSLPVMADRCLVILSEPERRRGNAAKELVAALGDSMADLLTQEQTVLVVAATKVDKRSRWVKSFREPAALVQCDTLRAGRDLTRFILDEAKRQEIEIEKAAAESLGEHVGPQLLLLRQEIAKASLLAGPGKKVERAHVEAGVSGGADAPIWDLTDAIGEGRGSEALATLSRMLESGVPAPVILAGLATHFRKLSIQAGGGTVAAPPFVQRKIERQARRFSQPRLVSCLRFIHETDTAIKGAGVLGPDLAVERLVIGLVG